MINNNIHMIRVQLVLIALLLGFLVGPRIFASGVDHEKKSAVTAPAQVATAGAAGGSYERSTAARRTEMPEIRARAAFVWDIKDRKIIFAKHEHDALPLASVTKMMVALVATELLPVDAMITIAPDDLREEGDSGLRAGEKWSLADLLDLTLVASSNDGASAIAAAAGAWLFTPGDDASANAIDRKRAFIGHMNERARELGLDDTHFRNVTGLDLGSVTEGASGSARDMAMLFEYVWKKYPELLSETVRPGFSVTSADKVTHRVANTNEIVDRVPGMLGSKTGYTDLAGGNLVIVLDVGIDHPLVIAVLGSTRGGRFDDVAVLADASIRAITHAP